VCETSALPLS